MPIDQTDEVSQLFIQTAKLVRNRAEQELSALGLHVGQDHLLMKLYEEDGRRSGEIAEKMAVDPSVVSKMLERMESQGLVERTTDPDDGRVRCVFLTERGRALQKDVEDFQHQLEEQMIRDLSTEERLLFRRMLSDLHENFSESDLVSC